MNTQRTRRLLIVAFALSLLIHVLFAANVRWRPASVETEVEHVSIVQRMRILRVTPPPTTPAPPRPHPAPSNIPKSHATPSSGRGTEVAAVTQPTPAPTQLPTPAPSPTADCMKSDALAAVTVTPDPPAEIPPAARADATSGTTRVRVDLSDRAVITAVAIATSSGNPGLDLIAETQARAAQYSPATHACKPVASSYYFEVKWAPW